MGILSGPVPGFSRFWRRQARNDGKRDTSICSGRANGRILNYDHYGRIYVLPSRGGRPGGVRLVNVLSELKVGETGVVETLELPESVQNYLMHLGFLPEARVTVLRRAPAGDPTVYAVDGMEIALRRETASGIRIRETDNSAAVTPADDAQGEAEAALPGQHEIPTAIGRGVDLGAAAGIALGAAR